jgi:hypothetical protein
MCATSFEAVKHWFPEKNKADRKAGCFSQMPRIHLWVTIGDIESLDKGECYHEIGDVM